MPDLAALMQAIVDAPADDAPRVAYARAVAANDPERAELIDIQLELARARRAHTEDGHDGLVREEILLRQHGARWAADVQPLVDKWQFLRGFTDVVTLAAERFLTVAPELYRRAPVLHLNLTKVKPVAAELFRSPHLARIRSLSLLHNGLGDAEVAALAASPYLANLAWLNLGNNKIGAAGVEAIAASRHLPHLGYVGLATNAIPDPTPRHADEYDAASPVAEALQRTYGPRPWLDARPRWRWPPPRDAVD
ncbi:MAG TPA: hypothetical protein VHW23_39440 [Kofleriaceae bacterium]|nr:hypothetical protein [Kofleriaceae bacterium]